MFKERRDVPDYDNCGRYCGMSFFTRIDPLGDGISYIEPVNFMGSDATIVDAARASFLNDAEIDIDPQEYESLREYILDKQRIRSEEFDEYKDGRLIRFLARNRHSSPFQQAQVSFVINIPMFLFRQWTRHRTWSYLQVNEVSRRYTADNIQFYFPQRLKRQASSNKQGSEGEMDELTSGILLRQMKKQAEISLSLYERVLNNGGSREEARMLLPQNLYTRVWASVDLWNLSHFYDLRAKSDAQWQVVEYSEAVALFMKELFPFTTKALMESA